MMKPHVVKAESLDYLQSCLSDAFSIADIPSAVGAFFPDTQSQA